MTVFQGKGASTAKNLYNLFYHELGNGCFIIEQVFRKKAVFLEKTAKNPFVGAHGSFEGSCPHMATKINITFFVSIDVLNIFYLISFSKKTIFSKITVKNNFWGHDHFWGNGASDDKNKYNLFHWK